MAFLLASYVRERSFSVNGVLIAAVSAASTYLVASVLFLPFTKAYELFYNGVDPSPAKTSLPHYLVIFGFFLFAIASMMVADISQSKTHRFWFAHIWDRLTRSPRASRRERLMALLVRPSPVLEFARYLIPLLLAATLVAALLKLHLIAFLLLFGTLAIISLFVEDSSPEKLLVLLFVGTGAALCLGVEFVTIKGDIGRMNTVFKFYLQAWFLFGIAAAVGVTGLLVRKNHLASQRASMWKTGWGLATLALFFSVLIYPVSATPVKLKLRFQETPLTLDGMAYMNGPVFNDQNSQIHLTRDYQAIKWIQTHIIGSPTILEAQIPEYRWGSRISIYTGLPTVLGWTWHERQQRWGYQTAIDQRLSDIKTMFDSADLAQVAALLKKYRVRLIYVGERERAYYSPSGLAKFESMVGEYLSVAYRGDGVTIYEVKVGDSQSVVISQ